jgi:hypothetical protein
MQAKIAILEIMTQVVGAYRERAIKIGLFSFAEGTGLAAAARQLNSSFVPLVCIDMSVCRNVISAAD